MHDLYATTATAVSQQVGDKINTHTHTHTLTHTHTHAHTTYTHLNRYTNAVCQKCSSFESFKHN